MFDLSEARLMAKACQLAYDGDSDAIMKQLNLTEIHTKAVGDQACYFGLDATGVGLFIFRGTATIGGWVSDLDVKMVATSEFPGRVHSGFYDDFMAMYPWILDRIKTAKNVKVTGHSLGGALAVLTAEKLKIPLLYTFGCPRVGNIVFARECYSEHHRVVNDIDIVACVPPPPFVHTGDEYRLPEGGAPSIFRWFNGLWKHLKNGLTTTVVDAIQDHLIESYIDAIQT